MSYLDLYQSMDQHIDTRERLIAYSKYYKGLHINGLHYVYQSDKPFLITVCNPNHTTNSLATSYLLSLYHKNTAKNTIFSKAQDLKKFLDFLFLWGIDLADGDPLPIYFGFADYLRLIPKSLRIQHAVLWATMDTVPLHQVALSLGKIITVGPIDDLLALERKEWSEYPYETIEKCVETAIEYYQWLQLRTIKYKDLPIALIPQNTIKTKSFTSATAGEGKRKVNAVRAILAQVGLKPSSNHTIKPFKQSKLILPDQSDWFLSTLKSSQDKLIFAILRYFGVRASEVASLRLNPSTIPDLRDPITAKQLIKKQLSGNIKWDKLGFWFIQIEESKTLNGIRTIPFLREWDLEQDWLTHLIYDALFERQALIKAGIGKNPDHGYLFVSKHHAYRGQPITGESVLKKFNYLTSKLASRDNCKYDLTNGYSPHSFRHLFATLLIMLNPQDDARICLLMGHGSIDTTKRIYFHIFEAARQSPSKDDSRTVKDMLKTFAIFANESDQHMEEYLVDDEDV